MVHPVPMPACSSYLRAAAEAEGMLMLFWADILGLFGVWKGIVGWGVDVSLFALLWCGVT